MGFGGLIHRVDMAEGEAWDYVDKNFQNWKEKILNKKEQILAPLSTGFSRRDYWSGLPFPSPVKWKTEKQLGKIKTNQKLGILKKLIKSKLIYQ